MSVCTRTSDNQVFVQWKDGGKTKRRYFGVGVVARANAETFNETITKPAPTPVGAEGPTFV